MTGPNKPLAAPCHTREENLVLYHYGDLEDAERAGLQAHLQECAGCAGYLQQLGALMPLTVKTDEPPANFWADYHRELRNKFDGAAEKTGWRRALAALFQPRLVPVFATAAVIALALTFTVGKSMWSTHDSVQDNEAMIEVLPVAENLEFFRAMDVLDNLDVLEFMASQDNAA